MKLFFVCTFALLFVDLNAAPANTFSKRSPPILPSLDPFYTPAPGYESQPVGSILNSRSVTDPFGVVVIPDSVEGAYQFLVRSEDTFGNPNAIVTTVFVPKNADPSKLLSYQVAQDSNYINCAPSYAMQLDSGLQEIVSVQLEEILIQAGINEGWYVVVPDYEGPLSSFGCGHQAGKATLNSVRAALKSGSFTGINSNAKVAYWGYSGGSIATGWAALHEQTYAPELVANTIGFAFGGIVADVAHTAKTNMGTPFAGLIFSAINGLSTQYSTLNTYLKANIYQNQVDNFQVAQQECLLQTLLTYPFASWSQYFKNGAGTLNDPVVVNVTNDNNMILSRLIPAAPLFFYNTAIDEIIPAGDADLLYNRLCAAGSDIEYHQNLLGEHGLEQFIGSGEAFVWLQERFSGQKVQRGCSKSYSMAAALDVKNLVGLAEDFQSALITLLADATSIYSFIS